MIYKKHKAFTLVELIVVVTILAILATIGFVSYSSYLTGVRDTNRLAQLVSISDGLELYRTKNNLPIPDDNVEVQINSETIAYQGYAGSNTLETIDFTKGGKDPKDDEYFTYYLTKDRKYFQLMGFLEEDVNITSSILSHTYAVDYSTRVPVVYGKKLGIFTDEQNIPIQELGSNIDLQTSDTTNIIAHITDTTTLTGSTAGNSDLEFIVNVLKIGGTISKSCKHLITKLPWLEGQDGAYLLDPIGGFPEFIYCDMTTDGGGWTFTTMLAETSTKNFFDTGNTEKITSLTDDISSKGLLSNIWTDNEKKDILIQCVSTNPTYANYQIPLLIYDFPKSDINNLEKDSKESSQFSTTSLKGSWNGQIFDYGTTYGSSADTASFYLRNAVGGQLVFQSYGSANIIMNPGCSSVGVCYTTGANTSSNLTNSQYCMTAIR